MKRIALLLLMLTVLCSCSASTKFQGFLPQEFDAVPTGSPTSDPLCIFKENPGKQYHMNYPYYVYRAEIVGIASREEGVIKASWMRPYYSTTFSIHITYNYTTEEEMDIYLTSMYNGTDEYQRYNMVLPNIGDEILIVENNIEIMEMILNHYRIIEVDGQEYCLPNNIVTEGVFEGGVAPPDEYKYTYTKEHDPEVLDYLRENDIVNPKVTEIFPLDVLVPQLIARETARNEAVLAGEFVYDDNNDWGKAHVQVIYPYDYTKGFEE